MGLKGAICASEDPLLIPNVVTPEPQVMQPTNRTQQSEHPFLERRHV